MNFEIIGDIANIEVIAAGPGVRDRERLRRVYGVGRWRKMKGMANVIGANGAFVYVEVHWYEAQNIGRKEFKIKPRSR